jgi:hypothetical protein
MRKYCDRRKENDILMDVHVFSLPEYENLLHIVMGKGINLDILMNLLIFRPFE